ncbi:MAG TPA: LacI family DNA-binding transcriptional regulator [Armatimonadota bacterium]|nr:LacI family DNA-binding transcriptional regulator [Armatimonadota bacterium]
MGNTPPRRHVTLKMISAECGLPVSTVSAALRGDRQNVGQATIERVREIAETMGYDPAASLSARRLQARASNTRVANDAVAVFIPPTFHYEQFFWRIFSGLFPVLNDNDYAVTVLATFKRNAQGIPWNRDDVPAIIRRGEIDGALVATIPESFAPLLAKLLEAPGFRSRPLVAIAYEQPGCLSVVADEFTGGYQAIHHLIELGHRHILAFLGDTSVNTYHAGTMRLRGMRQAVQECAADNTVNLIVPPYLFPAVPGWQSQLPEYLDRYPEITAVLAVNDEDASHMRDLLIARGVRVPEDFSLMGFDDTYSCRDIDGEPWLTTVHMPLEEIGRTAAEQLLQLLRQDTLPSEQPIILPTQLVVRRSTAPPPACPAKIS